jgi:hypothetical protein
VKEKANLCEVPNKGMGYLILAFRNIWAKAMGKVRRGYFVGIRPLAFGGGVIIDSPMPVPTKHCNNAHCCLFVDGPHSTHEHVSIF